MAPLGVRQPAYGDVGQDSIRQAARNRLQRNIKAQRGRGFGPEPGRSNNGPSGTPGNRVLRQFQGAPRGY